jgi:hypothetical protein
MKKVDKTGAVGRPITMDLTAQDQMVRQTEMAKDEHGKNAKEGERVAPLVETPDGELIETEDGLTSVDGQPISHETEEELEAKLQALTAELHAGNAPAPTIPPRPKLPEDEMVPVFKPEELGSAEEILRQHLQDTTFYAEKFRRHLVQRKKRGFSHSFTALISMVEHIEDRLDKEGI